ncbi:MAG: methyltransferase domain-containing protein [Bryobacterales bacterium]|nr:methyltransferase domain-containing protein [Bryobacterales bacterium]
MRTLSLLLTLFSICLSQTSTPSAYTAFLTWRKVPANAALTWEQATEKYEAKLRAEGISPTIASKTMSIIAAHDEGSYYDPVYSSPKPKSPTAPTPLLVEAAALRKPGRALDIAMGQGRNALYLARQGWDVTGFDTSQQGLNHARKSAAAARLRLNAIHASDEEFDFGVAQWDLIALIYPIEKRSVYRIRQALKPGGVAVVECSHKEGSNAPFEYGTNELLEIFSGFRIVKYEDSHRFHEWAGKTLRIVRLIAVK